MKFLYIFEKIDTEGNVEEFSQEFSSTEIIIGSGGRSELVFSDESIAEEHASFIIDESQLSIVDIHGVGDVYVNGSNEEKATLNSGDVIKIGGKEFSISQVDEYWILRVKENIQQAYSRDDIVGQIVDELNVNKIFPSLSLISCLAVLIVLIPFFILPMLGKNNSLVAPGAMSDSHNSFSNDCSTCHTKSFSKISNASCESCHKGMKHTDSLSKLVGLDKKLERDCVTCHTEHVGSQTSVHSRPGLCIDCHENPKSISDNENLLKISSILDHPEVKEESHSVSHIKYNHALHAKKKDFDCTNCHNFDGNDEKLVAKTSFKNNCQSCHEMHFDERVPELKVPHAEPDVVLKYMYSEYAKLYLNENPPANSSFNLSNKPGYASKVFSNNDERKFAKNVIMAESRYSEQSLFDGGACSTCHNISKNSNVDINLLESKYQVLSLAKEKNSSSHFSFNHAKHKSLSCESCHIDILKSSDVNKILKPSLKNCLSCHSDSLNGGKIKTDCVDCHDYHG